MRILRINAILTLNYGFFSWTGGEKVPKMLGGNMYKAFSCAFVQFLVCSTIPPPSHRWNCDNTYPGPMTFIFKRYIETLPRIRETGGLANLCLYVHSASFVPRSKSLRRTSGICIVVFIILRTRMIARNKNYRTLITRSEILSSDLDHYSSFHP